MAVGRVARIAGGAGVAGLGRWLNLPPRSLAYEARLAGGAATAMAVFLAGAGCWIIADGPAPGLLHAGAVAAGGLAVMTVALLVARRAIGPVRRSFLGSPRH